MKQPELSLMWVTWVMTILVILMISKYIQAERKYSEIMSAIHAYNDDQINLGRSDSIIAYTVIEDYPSFFWSRGALRRYMQRHNLDVLYPYLEWRGFHGHGV